MHYVSIYLLTIYRNVIYNQSVTKTEFNILLSLASGQKHGYQIMKEVRLQSSGELKIGPGSLYSTLDRLLRDRLIIESGSEKVQGRERKYYTLSPLGLQDLKQEVKKFQKIVSRARDLAILKYAI